ncbi:MAG: ATP-dependent DNA helicase RecG [Caldithrix sp.]|nr:ATP-dependent DNA helicase RecG [Caldithrix sp.]
MSTENNQEYPLQFLKGIGPKRAQVLARYGIETLYDLLNYFPRKYIDRRHIVPLDALHPEEEVTVIGKIEAAGVRRTRRNLFYITISDGKGILEAVWFHSLSYFKKLFNIGEWVSLSGKVKFYRGYQMVHPQYDRLGEGEIDNFFNTGKILPFYSENENFKKAGLNSFTFRKIFFHISFSELDEIREFFPDYLIIKRNLINRQEAYMQIHNPQDPEQLDKAVYRFKYEDFFYLQIMLALQRMHAKSQPLGTTFNKKSRRLEQFYRTLPFELTEAQKKVMREIRQDMRQSAPMNRLLQGDVGSGKTLIAVMAMLIAIDNGYQAALMVPTEILAEQHFYTVKTFLANLDINVNLLTGSIKGEQRRFLMHEIQSIEPQIIIGTHALIQESVDFKSLGLVIIDEQHRFGVMQRGLLMEKGIHADVLVMTATPIPRTLAMTAYGSLDVSVIDELPANRKPITTVWRFDNKAQEIYTFIMERINAGEQAYVVYPLVEETEKLDVKAATEGFEFLSTGPFRQLKVGLLHGRMRNEEKEQVMRAFLKNEIQILVATTVIEVGVDVSNVTIMLIEHAERFGLSQLHQLRGRVGRSHKKSYCILKTPYNIGDIAQKRMRIMTESQDGFIIAEKDLDLRGWGDFFGTKQSGMPEFRIANPIKDREILEQARQDAFELVQQDPYLRSEHHLRLNNIIRTQLKDRMELINIS